MTAARPPAGYRFDSVAVQKAVQRAKDLQILTAPDLAKPVGAMPWLIHGLWPLASHGPVAGRKKTMKSYMADGIALAVASGRDAFRNPNWYVPDRGGVIIFAGEGGERSTRSRLQRIARDVYGISNIAKLPIVVLPDYVQFDSDQFAGYLIRARETLGDEVVMMVIVDSVYNYHPSGQEVNVSNVYDRGPMFARQSALIRRVCAEYTSLLLVDHFRSTGDGRLDLDSISQSGMAEFADTWMLLAHRAEPDIDNGLFYLRAEVGSRQEWPGTAFDMDWDIGAYDDETGKWKGAMSVSARPRGHEKVITLKGKDNYTTDDQIRAAILEFAAANKWAKTKAEIISSAPGSNDRKRAVFAELATATGDERLICEKRKRDEGGRMVERDLWAAGEPKTRLGSQPGRQPGRQPRLPRSRLG